MEDNNELLQKIQAKRAKLSEEKTKTAVEEAAYDANEGGISNLNYGLANLFGMPMDLATAGLKIVGAVPTDYSPIGGSESIRNTMRSSGMVLPEEDTQPKSFIGNVGRITGESAVPAAGMFSLGGKLATRNVNTLSNFQRALVGSFNKPVKTVGAEGAAIFGAAGGAMVAEEYFPDNLVARTVAEMAGSMSPALATTVLQKMTDVGLITRNIKNMFSKTGTQVRAERRIGSEVRSQQEAIEQLADETILGLDPATQSGDVGLMGILKAAMNDDPKLFKAIEDATGESMELARNSLMRNNNPDAAVDYLKTLQYRAGVRSQQAINKLSPNASPEEIARVLRNNIEESLANARNVENTLWNKLPMEGTVDPSPITTKFRETLGSRSIASDPDEIPSYLSALIGRYNDKGVFVPGAAIKEPSFKVMKDLRSRMSRTIREESAKDAPNYNKIRIVRELQEEMYKSLSAASPEYEDAVKYSRELNRQFTEGRVGQMLGNERSGGIAVTPEGTLEFITNASSDNVRKGIRQLKEINPQAVKQVEEGIKSMFGTIAFRGDTGAFDTNRALLFMKNKKSLLEEFPTLRKQMEEAVSSQRITDTMNGAKIGNAISPFVKNKSVASLYLDGDVDKAMHRLLTAKNSEGQGRIMENMVRVLQGDESGEALEGLKSAFGQYMIKHAEPTEGVNTLSGTKFKRTLRDYRVAAEKLFSKEELKRLDTLGDELMKIENRNKASAAKGGVINDSPNKILGILARVGGAQLGGKMGASSAGGSLQSASIASSQARELLSKLTNDGAEQLLVRAVQDEGLLRQLLSEATPDNIRKLTKVYGRYIPASAVAGTQGILIGEDGKEKTVEDLSIADRKARIQQLLKQQEN